MQRMENRFMKTIRIWFINKKSIQTAAGILAIAMWIGFALTSNEWYIDTVLRMLGLAFLGFGAVQDLVERKIYTYVWMFHFLFQTAAFFTNGQNSMMDLLHVVGFGISMLTLYLIMKKHIGFADIMVLLALPYGFGLQTTVKTLLISSLLVLISGMIKSVVKKAWMNEEVPMIPMIYTALFFLQVFGKTN